MANCSKEFFIHLQHFQYEREMVIMGGNSFTSSDYEVAINKHVSDSSSVTKKAKQEALNTGMLNPLVDPSANGVIHMSKPFYERNEALQLWSLVAGMPMPIETRLDTTGSMHRNVDKAFKALPKLYDLCSSVLPGFDLQLATGIFGDISDKFVLCRPKFAHSADRLVERLTLMVPEGKGGDSPEDPHYGLFAGAYLTDARISKYGLKGYDFTVTDAAARYELVERQLIRIFGPEVFEKVIENGFNIDKKDLPSTKEVVNDLLKRAHAFCILIDEDNDARRFWNNIFSKDRIVRLPDINYLPHTQAVIVGLTEGTLTMDTAADFLIKNDVREGMAESLVRSVAHIPIGAQELLRLKLDRPLPKDGDLFRERTDLWPVENSETTLLIKDSSSEDTDIKWL